MLLDRLGKADRLFVNHATWKKLWYNIEMGWARIAKSYQGWIGKDHNLKFPEELKSLVWFYWPSYQHSHHPGHHLPIAIYMGYDFEIQWYLHNPPRALPSDPYQSEIVILWWVIFDYGCFPILHMHWTLQQNSICVTPVVTSAQSRCWTMFHGYWLSCRSMFFLN